MPQSLNSSFSCTFFSIHTLYESIVILNFQAVQIHLLLIHFVPSHVLILIFICADLSTRRGSVSAWFDFRGFKLVFVAQVFCVTMGGFVFRFLKGIPPLKDQWGYAFTVATMAFHIFIISPYLDVEKWTLPMLRFSMILLGFAMSSLVNIAIQPIYAGDALHKLVAKNFETAATVFQRYELQPISSITCFRKDDCTLYSD